MKGEKARPWTRTVTFELCHAPYASHSGFPTVSCRSGPERPVSVGRILTPPLEAVHCPKGVLAEFARHARVGVVDTKDSGLPLDALCERHCAHLPDRTVAASGLQRRKVQPAQLIDNSY